MQPSRVEESRIRDRAYAIWEADGRPEGRATEHWLLAEAQLAANGSAGKARKAPARRTVKKAEAGPAAEAASAKTAATQIRRKGKA